MKMIIVIFILLGLFSCRKKENVLISIDAFHPESNEVFGGLSFSIIEEDLANDNKKQLVYNGVLDQQGKASFSYETKKNCSYEIVMNDPETFDFCNEIPKAVFSWDIQNYKHSFQIIPCAYLKLDINNVDCSTGSDAIQVWATYLGEFNSYSANYPNGLYKSAYNCEDFISYEAAVKQGLYCIKRNIMKTPTWEYQYDTIYLQTNEHKIYEVTY